MKGLTLTDKEQARIQVLNGVIEAKVNVSKAAVLMGGERAPYVATIGSVPEGGSSCCGSREQGMKPATTTCAATQERVRELAKGTYAGSIIRT